MPAFALRRKLDVVDQRWRRHAARHGMIHASGGTELLGFGEIHTLSLGRLGDHAARNEALESLSKIEISGDTGPRGSLPRLHAVVPFEPETGIQALLPSHQVTSTPEGSWLTTLGTSASEAEALSQALCSSFEDEPPSPRLPVVLRLDERPSRETYGLMVSHALERIAESALNKVVLSRSVVLTAQEEFDAFATFDRMAQLEPSCVLYVVPTENAVFIGASPELLIARRGSFVESHPLAGTISLGDRQDRDGLMDSLKDLEEHRLVVVDIAERLTPLVNNLDVPAKPSMISLRSVAHLGSSITGSLAEPPGATALDLIAAIHPTPAIGGSPRKEALSVIRELEHGDRGPFGGAVGWMTADGDGEWVLGIRGAVLEGRQARIRAGAGIVAGSVPQGETEETRVKLASILDAVAPGSSRQLANASDFSDREPLASRLDQQGVRTPTS